MICCTPAWEKIGDMMASNIDSLWEEICVIVLTGSLAVCVCVCVNITQWSQIFICVIE